MNTTPIRVTLSPRAVTNTRLKGTLDGLSHRSLIRVVDQANDGDHTVHINMPEEYAAGTPRTIVIDHVQNEDTQRQALVSGAAASIPPDMVPDRLYAVIAAVNNELAVIPAQEAAHIAGRLEVPPGRPLLTPDQGRILRMLSRASTIAQISVELGCSERHARRHLRRLWTALGAKDRTSGIIRAAHYGLLEPCGQLDPRVTGENIETTRSSRTH